MNHTLGKRNTAGAARLVPAAALDQASIVEAYRRWAGVYDTVFGGVSSKADALARAFGPDVAPDPAVPSSMIPTVAPKLTLLVDEPAAAGLERAS